MRVIKWGGIALVIAALLGGLVYQRALTQAYHTVTLFDRDKIVENFSNMGGMFPVKKIAQQGKVWTLPKQLAQLPESYAYKGEQRKMDEFIRRSDTTALLVLKDGVIRYEEYFQNTRDTDQRISWSVAKSFLSALLGIAYADGHIQSLEEPVETYAPSLAGTGYEGVRIKDVLQMSSGIGFNEDYQDFNSDINRMGRTLAFGGSFDDFARTLRNEREPGTFLHYVSIDTHVLGMVLRGATGQSIQAYFADKLWSKLGAESDTYYITDWDGEPMVLGGLNMRTRDFARFGLLYLNNGRRDGEQIVPASWVHASVTPDAPHLQPGPRETANINLGYGYQWWVPENADQEFMALGVYDQFIYVNQKAGVVIVKNSTNIEFMDDNFESATETVEAFRAIVASLDTSTVASH